MMWPWKRMVRRRAFPKGSPIAALWSLNHRSAPACDTQSGKRMMSLCIPSSDALEGGDSSWLYHDGEAAGNAERFLRHGALAFYDVGSVDIIRKRPQTPEAARRGKGLAPAIERHPSTGGATTGVRIEQVVSSSAPTLVHPRPQ